MDQPPASAPDRSDDDHLVRLLREQPGAGAALLYDRYGRTVYAVALRVLGDSGAAEEVTQDVFVRCWRSIDRYRPERGSLQSWLLAITHHRAIDELRGRRGQHRRREAPEAQLAALAADEPGLDDALLRGEIRESLAALPPAQREVIELIFWGGLTRREAAARLGVPLGTVHTRLRLGMDKLRGAFEKIVGDE